MIKNTIFKVNEKPKFLGQCSKMDSATIDFAGVTVGDYISTGVTANLDAPTAHGVVLGTTDAFGLKKTSPSSRLALVIATVDVSPEQKKTVGIKLAFNGTEIDESECRVTVSQQDIGKLHSMWILEMDEGDEVSVLIANHTNQGEIDFGRGRMTLTAVDNN